MSHNNAVSQSCAAAKSPNTGGPLDNLAAAKTSKSLVFVLTQLHFGQRSSLPSVCQVDCPVAGQMYYTFTSVLRMIVKLAYIYDCPQLMSLA